jgi:hypothetical protein
MSKSQLKLKRNSMPQPLVGAELPVEVIDPFLTVENILHITKLDQLPPVVRNARTRPLPRYMSPETKRKVRKKVDYVVLPQVSVHRLEAWFLERNLVLWASYNEVVNYISSSGKRGRQPIKSLCKFDGIETNQRLVETAIKIRLRFPTPGVKRSHNITHMEKDAPEKCLPIRSKVESK